MQGDKKKTVFLDNSKPVLLRLSWTGNLKKPLMSFYGTEWKERGYGLCLCMYIWAGPKKGTVDGF